jgi:23S rRNA (uracil1939-C5)-methyltransferase
MSMRTEEPRTATTRGGEPSCPHFGRCGGCTRLDQPIARQLAEKSGRVAETLAPFIDDSSFRIEPPTVPDHPPLHDRMKLAWPARTGRTGRLALGLYARGTHELVRIRRCEIQHPVLTEVGREAERLFDAAGVRAYDDGAHDGDDGVRLRAFLARIAPGTGELLLGVATTGGVWTEGPELADAVLEAAATIAERFATRSGQRPIRPIGFVRNLHDAPGNSLLGPRQLALRGRDHQFDRADGLWFRLSFGTFYQVHRRSDQLLYRPALAALGSLSERRFVDAYAGVGTFGMRMLRGGAAEVRMVESHPRACADARASLKRNRLDAGIFIESALDDFVTNDPRAFRETDAVLVDPPRSGLGETVCRALVRDRPETIVYVACSPRGLARDLTTLVGPNDRTDSATPPGPYRIEHAETVDLFPHTEHIESICVLRAR